MSVFNIKLKTKNGNDSKKKETFTVFFKLKFGRGLRNTAAYTYRIMYSRGVHDTYKVLELKNPHLIQSVEELTLKVILNFCHIISSISKAENIDPDFIMFISPDLNWKQNRAWYFLSDVFKRTDFRLNKHFYKLNNYGLKIDDIEILERFVELNPNTKFMALDPGQDPAKYAKSIVICSQLKGRIEELTNNKKEDSIDTKT